VCDDFDDCLTALGGPEPEQRYNYDGKRMAFSAFEDLMLNETRSTRLDLHMCFYTSGYWR